MEIPKARSATLEAPPTRAWVLLIGLSGQGSETGDLALVEACCRFYGLDAKAGEPAELSSLGQAWTETLVAVVADASVLGTESNPAAWTSGPLKRVPILILGVDPQTDRATLRQVTGGAVREGFPLGGASPASIRLCADRATAGPLAGQRIPAPATSLGGLALAENVPPEDVIASVHGAAADVAAPWCVRLMPAGRVAWVAAAGAGRVEGGHFERAHFGRRPHLLALVLLFLQAVGKDRCWQTPGRFANLCIDDPLLKEPYGRMSYRALLAEAQKAGFHATIGFVPWNYDRNSPDVVELFRQNGRWLSIVVHGNNHDRFEFYGPQHWQAGDPWPVKSLAEQEAILRQALGRMERFSAGTGLPYDRVMVFPHAIGSAGTLRLLKRLGFAGTANYNNYPLGSPPPADLADCLGAANSDAAGFPAVRRDYPKNRAEWTVALDLFLGNPILFMAHEDLFAAGRTAFNETASLVARLEPAVRWTNLGEIFRGLYRQRRLHTNFWEVRMLSDEIDLRNEGPSLRHYSVRREDPHDPPMENMQVDGVDAPWERRGATMAVPVELAPGKACRIKVTRRAGSEGAWPVELRRRGLRNRTLRAMAELRDRHLSRWPAGRWITRLYHLEQRLRSRKSPWRDLVRTLWSGLKAVCGQPPGPGR